MKITTFLDQYFEQPKDNPEELVNIVLDLFGGEKPALKDQEFNLAKAQDLRDQITAALNSLPNDQKPKRNDRNKFLNALFDQLRKYHAPESAATGKVDVAPPQNLKVEVDITNDKPLADFDVSELAQEMADAHTSGNVARVFTVLMELRSRDGITENSQGDIMFAVSGADDPSVLVKETVLMWMAISVYDNDEYDGNLLMSGDELRADNQGDFYLGHTPLTAKGYLGKYSFESVVTKDGSARKLLKAIVAIYGSTQASLLDDKEWIVQEFKKNFSTKNLGLRWLSGLLAKYDKDPSSEAQWTKIQKLYERRLNAKKDRKLRPVFLDTPYDLPFFGNSTSVETEGKTEEKDDTVNPLDPHSESDSGNLVVQGSGSVSVTRNEDTSEQSFGEILLRDFRGALEMAKGNQKRLKRFLKAVQGLFSYYSSPAQDLQEVIENLDKTGDVNAALSGLARGLGVIPNRFKEFQPLEPGNGFANLYMHLFEIEEYKSNLNLKNVTGSLKHLVEGEPLLELEFSGPIQAVKEATGKLRTLDEKNSPPIVNNYRKALAKYV